MLYQNSKLGRETCLLFTRSSLMAETGKCAPSCLLKREGTSFISILEGTIYYNYFF